MRFVVFILLAFLGYAISQPAHPSKPRALTQFIQFYHEDGSKGNTQWSYYDCERNVSRFNAFLKNNGRGIYYVNVDYPKPVRYTVTTIWEAETICNVQDVKDLPCDYSYLQGYDYNSTVTLNGISAYKYVQYSQRNYYVNEIYVSAMNPEEWVASKQYKLGKLTAEARFEVFAPVVDPANFVLPSACFNNNVAPY